MAELTEAVAEVAESVAGDALTVANVSRSLSGRDFGLGAIFGGTISALTTFLWSRRHFELKYEKLANAEIDEMREHYRAKQAVVQEKPKLEKIVEEHGYIPPEPGKVNTVTPEPVKARLTGDRKGELVEEPSIKFEIRPKEDWDYEAELASRLTDIPYIIHRDEFGEKTDHSKVTLTYYEDDDILCDEDDKPIENKERLVGEGNLDRFGHGSNNPNTVYIRNELLSLDAEVIKNPSSYTEEVHGLKHSDRPRKNKPNARPRRNKSGDGS